MAARNKKVKLKDLDKAIEEDPFLVNEEKAIEVEPIEEIESKKLYVTLPTYSRKRRFMAEEQFKAGMLKEIGNLIVDGIELQPGKVYALPATDNVRLLLKNGTLMGGGRLHR